MKLKRLLIKGVIMRAGVIGSRTFNDYKLLKETLNDLDIDIIISGGAIGADSLAKKYCIENNIPIQEFIPDWKKFGKSAGIIRNKRIVKESDIIVAFWDGKSKGTLSSINIAKKENKYLKIINI